jgi:hypothetical protein
MLIHVHAGRGEAADCRRTRAALTQCGFGIANQFLICVAANEQVARHMASVRLKPAQIALVDVIRTVLSQIAIVAFARVGIRPNERIISRADATSSTVRGAWERATLVHIIGTVDAGPSCFAGAHKTAFGDRHVVMRVFALACVRAGATQRAFIDVHSANPVQWSEILSDEKLCSITAAGQKGQRPAHWHRANRQVFINNAGADQVSGVSEPCTVPQDV